MHGFLLWLTGGSGVGKQSLADTVAAILIDLGMEVEILDDPWDGDPAPERVMDLAETIITSAQASMERGWAAILSTDAPWRALRDEVREEIGEMVEVYCQDGEEEEGYETPEDPELVLKPGDEEENARAILVWLVEMDYVEVDADALDPEEQRTLSDMLSSLGYL